MRYELQPELSNVSYSRCSQYCLAQQQHWTWIYEVYARMLAIRIVTAVSKCLRAEDQQQMVALGGAGFDDFRI